jgi:hypothetical protein
MFATAISSLIQEEAASSPSTKWLIVHRKPKARDTDLRRRYSNSFHQTFILSFPS